MNYFMSAESACLAKPFPADFADEWSCSSVHGHVARQIVVGIEHLYGEKYAFNLKHINKSKKK